KKRAQCDRVRPSRALDLECCLEQYGIEFGLLRPRREGATDAKGRQQQYHRHEFSADRVHSHVNYLQMTYGRKPQSTNPQQSRHPKSRPWAAFDTRRSVSPKLAAMSQTGTELPIKLPEWMTGRSGTSVIPKGRVSSAWACTTATTSGRAS